jgi:protein BCP1
MVNVDFEWFDLDSEVDFHGLKNLLRQLFDVDSQLLDLSALADLILTQPWPMGSTVKVDGKETDPYALLTMFSLHQHRESAAVQDLVKYLTEKAQSNEALSQLAAVLSNPNSRVAFIISERLINVPSEIVPPLYKMFVEELPEALADGQPYNFTHYLIVSKTYREIASTLDQEDAPRTKKSKAGKGEKETYYFHPEDEALHKHAIAFGNYEFTKDLGDAAADSKRAFQEMGVKPQGHAILIEAGKFEGAVQGIAQYFNGGP